MAATFWYIIVDDVMKIITNADGAPCLSEHCPCYEFSFTCGDIDFLVATALHVTVTFSGITTTFTLAFDSDGSLSGSPNTWFISETDLWIPCIALDFTLESIAMQCIDGAMVIGFGFKHGGFHQNSGPLSPTVISNDPIHTTYGPFDMSGFLVAGCGSGADISFEVTM